MKIVVVHNTYQQPGGEDISFQSERNLLRDAGHEVIEHQRSNFEVARYSGLIGQIALAKHTIWASRQAQYTEGEIIMNVLWTCTMSGFVRASNSRNSRRVSLAQIVCLARAICPMSPE